jgi:hypothetical protein
MRWLRKTERSVRFAIRPPTAMATRLTGRPPGVVRAHLNRRVVRYEPMGRFRRSPRRTRAVEFTQRRGRAPRRQRVHRSALWHGRGRYEGEYGELLLKPFIAWTRLPAVDLVTDEPDHPTVPFFARLRAPVRGRHRAARHPGLRRRRRHKLTNGRQFTDMRMPDGVAVGPMDCASISTATGGGGWPARAGHDTSHSEGERIGQIRLPSRAPTSASRRNAIDCS